MDTLGVIDEITTTFNTLKSAFTAVVEPYWFENDLLVSLSGTRRLISEGLLSDSVNCNKVKERLQGLLSDMRSILNAWNKNIYSQSYLKYYVELLEPYLNDMKDILENCRNSHFEKMKIGCNDFLSVYANVDVLKDRVPESITVDGQRVAVRTLRDDGFKALYFKLDEPLQTTSIGIYAKRSIRSAAFLLVICEETPFVLKAFKVIHQTPLRGYVWDVSGGLQSYVQGRGLGTRLMKATEALGHAYGIDKIKIEVVDSARDFYEKFGMKNTEDDTTRNPGGGVHTTFWNRYMTKQIGVTRGRHYYKMEEVTGGASSFIQSVFYRAGIRGGMPKRTFGEMYEEEWSMDYDQARRQIVIKQLEEAKAKYAENLTILCGAVRMGQVNVPSSFYELLKRQNDDILALQGQLARPAR
jgi:GNAT superfamily N-acetyltransferase